jgi:hypothetical protein
VYEDYLTSSDAISNIKFIYYIGGLLLFGDSNHTGRIVIFAEIDKEKRVYIKIIYVLRSSLPPSYDSSKPEDLFILHNRGPNIMPFLICYCVDATCEEGVKAETGIVIGKERLERFYNNEIMFSFSMSYKECTADTMYIPTIEDLPFTDELYPLLEMVNLGS